MVRSLPVDGIIIGKNHDPPIARSPCARSGRLCAATGVATTARPIVERFDGDGAIFITYSDDAAVRVHKLAPEMMLSVSMDAPGDINTLERRGINLTRVLAWTGTETTDPSLNRALAARGIEAMFGTLGSRASSWDGRFARDRRDRYAEFAKTGLQLIATDRPADAARDLDANDGVEGIGAKRCTLPTEMPRV